MDDFKVEDLKIILAHYDEQYNQPIRDFFRALGADWDRGDKVILNARIFKIDLPECLKGRVIISNVFIDDVPGYVFNENLLNRWSNTMFSEGPWS